MDVSKRSGALDITRICALLSVISIHFFLNTGYYNEPMLGKSMILFTVLRTAFSACVPLFLLLTGYLQNKKTFSGKYYLGIVKTLGTHALISLACMLYKSAVHGVEYSPKGVLFGVLDFTGANYSWYIEMYIGLFLLIPFLNAMYHGLQTRRAKLALIVTMLALTSLPSVVNIYNFSVDGWFATPYLSVEYQKLIPDFWNVLYPITYYFIGAYLKEYPIRINRWLNLLYIAAAVVGFGLFNYYRSWGGFYSWGAYQDWFGLPTVVLAVLIFVFLSSRNTEKAPILVKKMSDLCLGAYLVSYIFDDYLYARLCERVATFGERIWYFVPMVAAVAVLSLIASAAVNLIYSAAEKAVKAIAAAVRGRCKQQ